MNDIGGGKNTITPLPFVIDGGDYSASAIYEPKTAVKYTNGIRYSMIHDEAITGIPCTDTGYWTLWSATVAASTIAWSDITDKPATFDAGKLQGINVSITTPTANQVLKYNSGTSEWTPSSSAVEWDDISSIPTSFTPSAHTHIASDVTSGIFATARIPDLDASKIITGSLPVGRGGTGLSAVGGANTVLGINSGATGFEYKTFTQGTGITISHAANSITIASSATGTVTNVGLSLPAFIAVSNTPVTGTGTLTGTLATQAANTVFSGPTIGADAQPTFRILVPADVPSLDASKIGSGTLSIPRGGTGQVTANAALNAILPTQTSNTGKVLSTNGTDTAWIPAGGTGTVTSVGLTAPASLFTVSGSPVTGSSILNFALISQNQNTVLAGPNGSSGTPTMRLLVAADIPGHNHIKSDITDFAHEHNSLYYTKTQLNTNGAGGVVDWNNITSAPTQFDANKLQTRNVAATAPTNGQVLTYNTGSSAWGPATPVGTGDMLKSTYDANNDGIVDLASAVPWGGITSVPTTFAPSAHTHPASDISNFTEAVQDVVGAFATSSASILFTYSDVGDSLTAVVKVDNSTIIAGGSSINAANGSALWNANQLQSRAFASTAPSDGQVITWDASGTTWKPSSAADPSPAFPSPLTDGATITWNLNSAKVSNQSVTLGGNRTLSITNAVNGSTGVLIVKQDSTGGRTLTLPATSKMIDGGAGAWTPTVGANKVDFLTFIYDGTNYWWTKGPNYN